MGVEDTDLGPAFLVHRDKLQVAIRHLVAIMRVAISKDDMQGHIKVPLVDRSIKIWNQRSNGKVDRAIMSSEIVAAGRTQLFDPVRIVVIEGEVDDVGDL